MINTARRLLGRTYIADCDLMAALSCRSWDVISFDNTFRPKYEYAGVDCSLSEEKIALLQNVAHEAVAELKK